MTSGPTSTRHILPFASLSPGDFERLVYWLLVAGDYQDLEHVGAAGMEHGVDIVAHRVGERGPERTYVQCKRVATFTPSEFEAAVEKVRLAVEYGHWPQPVRMLFAVTVEPSAEARRRCVTACEQAGFGCEFLTLHELDRRVKLQSEALWEFFRIRYKTVGSGAVVVGQLPSEPQSFVRRNLVPRLTRELAASQVVVVTALTGMRGVGKTQVAAAYARIAVEDRVPLVAWVNAESADSLMDGLARVADRLSVAPEGTDRDEAVRLLREHLATWESPSLIVLDNAEDPNLLSTVLPATGRAKVIITTTNRRFHDLATAIDVDTFERSESVDYLLRRTNSRDRIGADAVAHELGDLPLALAAVSAYTRRRGLSFPQCLADLEAYPVVDVLGRESQVGYPHSTVAALLLAIDAVETSAGGEVVRALLSIVANLSPDGVNRGVLTQVAAGTGTDWTEYDIQEALERCVSASILSWSQDHNAVIMHRLMGRVIRERTDRSGRGDAAVSETLRILEDGIDADPTWRGRDASLHLVQQIEALSAHVFSPEDETDQSEADSG
jgi:hypothetical protein